MKSCPYCGKVLPKVARTNNYTIKFNYLDAKFEGINGEIDIWKDKYPAINVLSEIKKAEGWCFNNPKNKKSNWKSFLGKWMARAQDKAPSQGRMIGEDMRSAKAQLLAQLKDRSCTGMKSNYLSNEAVELFYSLNRHWRDIQKDVLCGKDIFAEPMPDLKSAAANDKINSGVEDS